MQSESIELWILLRWSDELTILFLCLSRSTRVAYSKYEDINEIFLSSKHSTGGWGRASLGGLQPPQASPRKIATATDMFDVVRQKSD